jgi:hypothetical protein
MQTDLTHNTFLKRPISTLFGKQRINGYQRLYPRNDELDSFREQLSETQTQRKLLAAVCMIHVMEATDLHNTHEREREVLKTCQPNTVLDCSLRGPGDVVLAFARDLKSKSMVSTLACDGHGSMHVQVRFGQYHNARAFIAAHYPSLKLELLAIAV